MIDDAPEVPERYRGVWVRTLLETPSHRDDQTFVRWLQTGRWHADLRVPARLVRPTCAPAQWTPVEQAALATQQGFCGVTEVQAQGAGEICAWRRRFDYQPSGLTPDEGWMAFESSERVIETGVHGEYLEVWERLPGSAGGWAVLKAPTGEGSTATTLLLVTGPYAMRVRTRTIGWPEGTAAGESLLDLGRRHAASFAALLDFEISFGCLEDGRFSIERSTLPALEGCTERCLVERESEHAAHVDGAQGGSAWQILGWAVAGQRLP